MSGDDFLARLRERGFDFYSGVPCSLLIGFFESLEEATDLRHVHAVREDEAIGHAAGAWLGGRRPVVYMQNSGLGNALNAIVSLSQIYGLPFLMLITWRGEGGRDAPEHLVMGDAMTKILDVIRMSWQVLDPARVDAQLDAACQEMDAGRPAALVVRKGLLG